MSVWLEAAARRRSVRRRWLVRLSTALGGLGGLGGLEGAGIRVAELKGTRLGSIVLGWNRL